MTSAPDRLLRRLEWQLGKRLDGRLQGSYRTVWRGGGIDFLDLRPYTAEDDVRHIDWNVTARLDEPFVRQYTEDRDVTAWMVVDKSASMRFGRGEQGRAGQEGPAGQKGSAGQEGKESLATELALSLARLLSQGGNRVGAILYDNGSHQVIPPRAGREQILRLARELTRPPDGRGRGRETTDLKAMLELAAAVTTQRRSLVFVLSDLIGETGWDDPLKKLTFRHEVVVLRLVDPAELELPDVGLILVQDAETGEQVLVDTSDPLLRRRLTEQVERREERVGTGLRGAGVTAHRISTDQDPLTVLVDLVRGSARRRRR